MNDETIGSWLDELASSAPAPGGGAAGALEVAMAAALVEMVCNLTIGKPAYAEHEATMTAVRDHATEIRGTAVGLAAEDAEAFTSVIDAYRLPKETETEGGRGRTCRKRSRGPPTCRGAQPRRHPRCSTSPNASSRARTPNVVSDVAAAAGAARGALHSSLVNLDANLVSIDDPGSAGRARRRERR